MADQTGECWVWQGALDYRGYGRCTFDYHTTRAHRIAWKLTHGPIPRGLFVCHHCDNPPCIRPEHLFLGTNQENFWDMKRKGRGRQRRLTWEQVHEIRRRYVPRKVTYKQLGAEFGVANTTICAIIRRQNWSGAGMG